MRDIKFRIWDKQEKEMMFEGFHIFGEITLFNAIAQHAFETKGERSSLERYNDFEIMQFIGLKDLHGKDIYEGDILDEDGHLFEVKYSSKWAKFHLNSINHIQYPEWNRGVNMNIVGNIHANPELIK